MPEKYKEIADGADVIFDGYAFTRGANNIRVFNLNAKHNAAVITPEGEVIETSMDDIEIQLMLSYYDRISKYLEA